MEGRTEMKGGRKGEQSKQNRDKQRQTVTKHGKRNKGYVTDRQTDSERGRGGGGKIR